MYFVWTGQTRLDAVEDEEDAKLIENILKRVKIDIGRLNGHQNAGCKLHWKK